VFPETRGNPMSLLRWTLKSIYTLARELQRAGFKVSAESVRLARLWRTLPTENRRARGDDRRTRRHPLRHQDALAPTPTAVTTGPLSPAPAAVVDGLDELGKRVSYLRANLDHGVALEDMIGPYGGSARLLEETTEALAIHLEHAERRAGRPPLTDAQAAADIAERLRW
jgi:hypothetical protein